MKLLTTEVAKKHIPNLKMGVYGFSGAGKTWLGVHAPKPLIIVTNPRALDTIAQIWRDDPNCPRDNVILVDATDNPKGQRMQEIRCIYKQLATSQPNTEAPGVTPPSIHVVIREPSEEGSSDPGPKSRVIFEGNISTIVLDTVSDIQAMVTEELLRGGFSGKTKETLSMDGWQVLKRRTLGILKGFMGLPVNVLAMFLSREYIVDETTQIVRPLLEVKALVDEINPYFDVFGYLRRRKVEEDDTGGKFVHEVMFGGDETVSVKGHKALHAVEMPDVGRWIASVTGAAAPLAEDIKPKTAAEVKADMDRRGIEPKPPEAEEVDDGEDVPPPDDDDAPVEDDGLDYDDGPAEALAEEERNPVSADPDVQHAKDEAKPPRKGCKSKTDKPKDDEKDQWGF